MDYTILVIMETENDLKLLVGEEEALTRVIKSVEEINGDTDLASLENSALCILEEEGESLLKNELILEELLAKDIVGLVVHTESIPYSFMEKAKVCRIPIIATTGDGAQQTLNHLKRNLASSAVNLMEYNLKLQQTFQDILLEDGGFKTICSQLSRLIGNPVLVLDRFKEDIIYLDRSLRDEREKFFQMELRKLLSIKEIYNRHNYQINRVTYEINNEVEKELHIKIGKSKDTLAYLVIVEKKVINREQDFIAIIQATNTLAIKLNFNRFVQTLARKSCNELIRELLAGKTQDQEALIKRGELAGWDLTLPYQLYIFRFKDYYQFHEEDEGEGVFLLFDYQEKVIRWIHRVMKNRFSYRYIIFDYQDDILLLVNIHTDGLERKRREVVNIVQDELRAKFKKLEFSIGCGRYYNNCLDIRQSYQEGLKALTVLCQGSIVDTILFFEDIGIMQILWDVDRNNLITFTVERLRGLMEYDRESQSDLIDTLGMYLACDGRIQETAERLRVHPNTISYRVKRINEILGCDLKDFETKLNLSIAYKIYKFIYEHELTKNGEKERVGL